MTQIYAERGVIGEQIQTGSYDTRIGLIGLGNIGTPFAAGLLESGILGTSQLLISNRDRTRTLEKTQTEGIAGDALFTETNDSLLNSSDMVFVAIDKKGLGKELVRWKENNLIRPDQLIVSFAAGIRINTLKRWLGNMEQPMARIMPNTAIRERKGTTSWTVSDEVTKGQMKTLQTILGALGTEIYVETERELDILTIVAASFPGLLHEVSRTAVEVAVKMGLNRQKAEIGVRGAQYGSGISAISSGLSHEKLIGKIATEGGTTQAMLERASELHLSQSLELIFQRGLERADEIEDHWENAVL